MKNTILAFTTFFIMFASLPGFAEPIGNPPILVATVEAPGGYPFVPSEPYLISVEKLAKEELRILSKAGRIDATIQLARLLWMDGNRIAPVELLTEPTANGIPVAQYLLGMYMRFNKGDKPRSLKLLQDAARQGHAIAQETLAIYYESGTDGVEKNVEEAFRWYLAAGKQGLRHSQMNVGMYLCIGRGVEEDKKTGRAWFLNSQQGQRMPLPPRSAGCE
jgi:TPR repeat protein